MKYIISTIIIFLTFSYSCTSFYYIGIDVREPAPITLGLDAKKIIIADNTFPKKNINSAKQIIYHDSLIQKLSDTVKFVLKESFIKYINEEKVFDTVEIYPYYPRPLYLYNEAINQKELPLTEEQILDICDKTSTDVLLSLDLLNLRFQPFGFYPYGYATGYIESTIRVYAYNENIIGIPIRLKQSFNANVDLQNKDSILPRLKSTSTENAKWIADAYVNYFIPRWESQDRIYYKKSAKPSYSTILLMDKNEWKKAASLWEKEFEKEKGWKKKAKWASNTALSYEYIDDIDSALKWINIAHNLLPTNNKGGLAEQIRDYRIRLMKRKQNIPLLRKQLRIEDPISYND